jgi:hypothetical protein
VKRSTNIPATEQKRRRRVVNIAKERGNLNRFSNRFTKGLIIRERIKAMIKG